MTSVAVPVSDGGGPSRHGPRWLRLGGAAVAIAVVVGWLAPAILLALAATGIIAWLSARPKRAFVTLCCLLPLHTVVIAGLFGGLGLSETVVRVIAAWKEALVLVVFMATAVRAAARRSAGARVEWLDLAVGALGAMVLADLIAREPFGGTMVPLLGQLYGTRDAGLFLLLYFVGRSSGDEMATDGVLDTFLAVGALTALVAILERLFVPPELLVAIGTTKYFSEFLNLGVMLRSDEIGLPQNYFTDIGGKLVPRAGSTYLSSQAFAISFLLIMPAATISVLSRHRRGRLIRWIAYGVAWIGLLLSVTRMSIVCAFIEACIVAWYLHRRGAIVGILAGFGAVAALAIAVVPGFSDFVLESLVFGTSSGTVHVSEWQNGIAALMDHPFGMGLATADATGDRFGAVHVTGDNLYLKYGVELGVAAMVILVIILITIAVRGRRLALRGSTVTTRNFGILVLAATFGIAVNSVSSTLFTGQFIAYLYFWLAGAAVTMANAER